MGTGVYHSMSETRNGALSAALPRGIGARRDAQDVQVPNHLIETPTKCPHHHKLALGTRTWRSHGAMARRIY